MTTLELEARLDNLLTTAQAETADIDIFAPLPEREECPICMIPLPLIDSEIRFMTCCGKSLCMGCTIKNILSDMKKGTPSDKRKCAFCRLPISKNNMKALKKLMKNNNPEAFMAMAQEYKSGEDVFQSDTKALEMYAHAAELDLANAFDHIGYSYREGILVEQDTSKALVFYEIAAKKGSLMAHQYLASFHVKNGNIDISIRHLTVAASAGDQDSMDLLMKAYKDKLLSKEELTQTLRAFQEAKDLMKSEDRDTARLLEESRIRGEDPPDHILASMNVS